MLRTRAWLSRAKRRHPGGVPVWQWRRELIPRIAAGKTFIDVGGMFSVHGDASFLAEEAGATRVVLLDAMPATEEFKRKHSERNSKVEYLPGDLHNSEKLRQLGRFDVVWCTGVIYHTPHPMLQIENLRLMVEDTFVLGTHVIPEIPGIPNGALFYPRISKDMIEEFARAHAVSDERYPGMASEWNPDPVAAYANFWWGMAPSTVRSMLDICGFDIQETNEPSQFLFDALTTLRPEAKRHLEMMEQELERRRAAADA